MLEKEKEKDNTPHITNLNEDNALSGVIHHLIQPGDVNFMVHSIVIFAEV